MYIRIVSKRAGGVRARAGERVIDVDRSNRVLGNKHVMQAGADPRGERDRVIAANAVDLANDEAVNGPMSRALDEVAAIVDSGTPVAFQCWCWPLPCHAGNYQKAVERRLGRSLTPPDCQSPAQEPSMNQGALF